MIAARYFCCAAASTRYAAKRESRNMSDINGSKPTNFPLDESKLDFKIPRTDAPRENVLKLGSMITNRIGLKATADDPEYWGLAGVMTDEMVDVALKMGVRKPKTTEQLMKLTKMEREPLEKLLTEMAWTGIIEYNWENLDGKNPKHEKRWVLPLFVPGSAEFLNMRKSQIDEHPEVAAFFERMTMLPLEKITPMVPPGGAGIGMHVIPVEKAIETENESVDLEHISYWLSKYEGKYAKSMCSCRASRAKLGEGCGDDAESWCIGVGDMADYIVETQRGEYITKDEALEIFKKAEDNGFVHQITNIDGEQKIFGICNCNVNVCNALRTSQLFNTPNLSRSAYVASVESESCVACGRCVENCPAGAVKLGAEALHEGRLHRISPSGITRRCQVGAGKVEHRLPRQEPHQLLQYRYLAVQDGLPSAHRGAGLSEACRAGQVPRSLAAHQARKSVPRGLRPHLQPPLRGCLHARYGRSGRRH